MNNKANGSRYGELNYNYKDSPTTSIYKDGKPDFDATSNKLAAIALGNIEFILAGYQSKKKKNETIDVSSARLATEGSVNEEEKLVGPDRAWKIMSATPTGMSVKNIGYAQFCLAYALFKQERDALLKADPMGLTPDQKKEREKIKTETPAEENSKFFTSQIGRELISTGKVMVNDERIMTSNQENRRMTERANNPVELTVDRSQPLPAVTPATELEKLKIDRKKFLVPVGKP
jgi:hypothetical protein